MNIKNRIEVVVKEFQAIPHWEDKYKKIIEMGKSLKPLDESKKTEDNKIKGCQSQVWLVASPTVDHKIQFQADSDALIVKGLVSILVSIYSHSSPDEILANPPTFLKDLGFESHLSPSRANGLHAMVKQMQFYAIAYRQLFVSK
jgi:cysteine desulfuration protein SufE